MAETYRTVTKKGFGTRLKESIKGIFFGFVIFIAAFPLLWWGETRQNLAEFVEQATAIEPTGQPAVETNALVKVTAAVSSPQKIRDAVFLPTLPGENILFLARHVQMYAWKENVKTEKEGDKEIKTYTYEKGWTSSAQDSSRFHISAGHYNPPKTIKDKRFQVTKATVGEISFNASDTRFYKTAPLAMTKPQVLQTHRGQKTILSNGGEYLYLPFSSIQTNRPKPAQPMRYDPQTGRPIPPPPEEEFAPSAGSPVVPAQRAVQRDPETDPQVGDTRLSYKYYEGNKQGTVVGSWNGNQIAPHVYRKTGTFLGVYPGSAELFAVYLEKQHRMVSWIIRIASFLMLWLGMNMILGPILVTMGAIPILGQLGKGMTTLVTGVIAFVLWLLTLTLANLWLILLIVAVLGIGTLIYVKKKKGEVPPPVSSETG